MITFETLRNVQREERGAALAKLPEDFYLEVNEYIGNLEKLCKDEDAKSIEAVELTNVKNVLQDIHERREKKITNMALLATQGDKVDTKNITPAEVGLLEGLVASLKKHRADSFEELEKVKKEKGERMRVRFLADFPAFVGVDLKEHGPFRRGETTDLPKTNAEILLKKGIAEK